MGVVPNTNIHALLKKCGGNVARVAEERAINKLSYLGERFIIAYKDPGRYLDQTSNLRSSGGYVVVRSGSIVAQKFEQVKDGAEGVKEGKKLAKSLAGKYNKGYVLICMAGMEYAVCLEAMDYDVIDTAEHAVRRSWDKLMKK